LFSVRSSIDPAPNPLAERLAAARAAGRGRIDLTVSNPTVVGLPRDWAAVTAALADARGARYDPHPLGAAEARAAVAAVWRAEGVTISPERLLLTASTSEAYGLLFQLLCDPGDQLLVPRPSYPLLDHLARLADVGLVDYPLSYDGAWHLDVERIARRRTPRTRGVVVVSPNNPTGSRLGRDELSALARLGLPVISDEVFGSYVHEERAGRAPSALVEDGVLVFALDGLSKRCALPQLKLGWIGIGGPLDQVSEAQTRLEIAADAYLSVGTPVQLALPALLRSSAPTVTALRARLARNLAQVRAACAGTPVTLLDLEAGWSAILRLPAVATEDDWVLTLLERDDVVCQPGWFYDFDFGPCLIVSLLTPEATLAHGVERIVALAADPGALPPSGRGRVPVAARRGGRRRRAP